MKRTSIIAAAFIAAGFSGCSNDPAIGTAVTKASALVTEACASFQRTKVQLALDVAASLSSTVGELKSYGDRFCAEGPPPGDATTPAQQASWLNDLTSKLVSLVRR